MTFKLAKNQADVVAFLKANSPEAGAAPQDASAPAAGAAPAAAPAADAPAAGAPAAPASN